MSEGWDVRTYWAALQESGLEGLSHENGWTLMATATAAGLRRRITELELHVDRLTAELGRAGHV